MARFAKMKLMAVKGGWRVVDEAPGEGGKAVAIAEA